MDMLLTLLVLSVLIGFVRPQLVRSRPHLLVASAGVVLSMVLLALGELARAPAFVGIAYLTDAAVVALLIGAASGSKWMELAREVGYALRQL